MKHKDGFHIGYFGAIDKASSRCLPTPRLPEPNSLGISWALRTIIFVYPDMYLKDDATLKSVIQENRKSMEWSRLTCPAPTGQP